MSRLSEPRHHLNFPFSRHVNSPLPRLFAMTDMGRGDDPLVLVNRLPAGTGLVFRHYESPNRAKLAAKVISSCKKQGLFCFIAGDVKLANALKADGVHLPEWQIHNPPYGLANFRSKGGRVTCAAHSLAAVYRAERLHVDGIFLSPVFPSKSHEGARHLGLTRFSNIARNRSTAIFALGGVDASSTRRLVFAGAYGLAGIGLFQ